MALLQKTTLLCTSSASIVSTIYAKRTFIGTRQKEQLLQRHESRANKFRSQNLQEDETSVAASGVDHGRSPGARALSQNPCEIGTMQEGS